MRNRGPSITVLTARNSWSGSVSATLCRGLQLAIEAGVPPLTPHHAARHGWATLALTADVAPKLVQERVAHSSISITMDRYGM